MDRTSYDSGTACVDVKKNISAIECEYGDPNLFITIAAADLPSVSGPGGNGEPVIQGT